MIERLLERAIPPMADRGFGFLPAIYNKRSFQIFLKRLPQSPSESIHPSVRQSVSGMDINFIFRNDLRLKRRKRPVIILVERLVQLCFCSNHYTIVLDKELRHYCVDKCFSRIFIGNLIESRFSDACRNHCIIIHTRYSQRIQLPRTSVALRRSMMLFTIL